jgi:hypothetical protein
MISDPRVTIPAQATPQDAILRDYQRAIAQLTRCESALLRGDYDHLLTEHADLLILVAQIGALVIDLLDRTARAARETGGTTAAAHDASTTASAR